MQQGLFVTATFGLLGAADDWIKIRTHKRGLTARTEVSVPAVCLSTSRIRLAVLREHDKPHGLEIVWPIGKLAISLGPLLGSGRLLMVAARTR